MTDLVPSLDDRDALARHIIERGTTPADLSLQREPPRRGGRALELAFPEDLAPIGQELPHEPALDDPLPAANVLVITWTADEHQALCDVLTPDVTRNGWYRYTRHYSELEPQIKPGAPARVAKRLGSYYLTRIGDRRVLCLKSELHLNQDGIQTAPGQATLPVADLIRHAIAEAGPQLVITTGTCGATMPDHGLGDVVITRAAKFRLAREFAAAPFAGASYRNDFPLPTGQLDAAEALMATTHAHLVEPPFGPPTDRYPWTGPLLQPPPPQPRLRLDGRDMPAFHPILSTDWFEFGTSTNGLDAEGCGVEMGDAVLGMACQELGDGAPRWLIVRNLSNPQINGHLQGRPQRPDMQALWSGFYYDTYGYWTSVNGAIATWAMVAGEG